MARDYEPAINLTDSGFSNAVIAYVNRNQITYADLARQLGWIHNQEEKGDTSRVRRAVGLVPYNSHGKRYHKKKIRRKLAEEICIIINRDVREFE